MGTAVTEELPVRAFPQYLGGAQPLVFAVIPLHKISVYLRNRSEAGQFAGSHGALQRGLELYRKAMSAEPDNSTIRISYALLAASLVPASVAAPSRRDPWLHGDRHPRTGGVGAGLRRPVADAP